MLGNSNDKNGVHPTSLGKLILRSNLGELYQSTDRLFVVLLAMQWALAISISVFLEPYSWSGRVRTINTHLEMAIVLGGFLTIFPIWLLRHRSGTSLARYVVAITQGFWSIFLIHLTGGRIETHFHIFGSLAFIAFYRDWKLLVPTTLIIGVSHFLGAFGVPGLAMGTSSHEWWRILEHIAWIGFVDLFLVIACIRSYREMEVGAERQAELKIIQARIQCEVELKTKELTDSNSQREQLQTELMNSHKLESIGRLASGIAHEINTPIQYVTDSVFFAQEGVQELFDLLEKLGGASSSSSFTEEQREWINELTYDSEILYLKENLPKALERSTDGLQKVAEIVRSMKQFAYPDQKQMVPTDINESIRTTLVVCRNEYKYLATVQQDLGEIPNVLCHGGELNQVLTNLIVNAAHAISERYVDPSEMGVITIKTSQVNDQVEISVSDTGCGIAAENLDKIFEPFYTTKAVGRGTGQGLAIVRGVVVNKLHGAISVQSKLNEGTTFTLRLPIDQVKEKAA